MQKRHWKTRLVLKIQIVEQIYSNVSPVLALLAALALTARTESENTLFLTPFNQNKPSTDAWAEKCRHFRLELTRKRSAKECTIREWAQLKHIRRMSLTEKRRHNYSLTERRDKIGIEMKNTGISGEMARLSPPDTRLRGLSTALDNSGLWAHRQRTERWAVVRHREPESKRHRIIEINIFAQLFVEVIENYFCFKYRRIAFWCF